MTDRKELEALAAKARQKGATVIINEAMDDGGSLFIETVQVIGLKGCGTFPMSPISCAERLRELTA